MAAVVLGAGLNAFSTLSADTDLWGHILFGEAHWTSGHLDRVDSYAFTSKDSWINHEWLTELVFYLCYRWAGDFGLLILKLLVGLATLALLAAMSYRRGGSPLVMAIALTLAAFSLTPGFMFRPQIFSYLLFAVTLDLLRPESSEMGRPVVLLPLVMALWVNLHGGFLIGAAIVAVVVVIEGVGGVIHSRLDRAVRWLMVGAAAAVATLANPYGWELHRFLLRTLTVHRPIGEWAPLPLFDDSFVEVKVMLVATIAVGIWLVRQGRLRLAEAAILLVTAVAMLRHQRHAPFFVIAATPMLVDGLSRWIEHMRDRIGDSHRFTLPARPVAVGLGLIAALEIATAALNVTASRARIFVDPELYPVQATDLLVRNGAAGRLLLPFEWGEYAIWHLYPACRVSIDGRYRTVYPEQVLVDHYSAASDPSRWELLMDRYRADLAMIERSPAVDEMAMDPPAGWTTIWVDPLAVVLVRDIGASAALAEEAANGEMEPPRDPPGVLFP